MIVYAAYDEYNGIQLFEDQPDRVNFNGGLEWTGYPYTPKDPSIASKIKKLPEVAALEWEDAPVKVEVKVVIKVVE